MKLSNISDPELKEAAELLGKLKRCHSYQVYEILENKTFPVCLALFESLLELEKYSRDTKRQMIIKIMRPEINAEILKTYKN